MPHVLEHKAALGLNTKASKYDSSGPLIAIGVLVVSLFSSASAQDIQPLVAIHDSELTRFLDSSNAPASGTTPTGAGTTGLQWWIRDWHYFILPEAMKEAMRADGTAFTVVGDSNITAGIMLTNGGPKYPILICLGSEAVRDDEIASLTNYVAAGGILFVGSSAFTRNTNGTTRGDFAFANELGLHMVASGLTNWALNANFTKQQEHRIISHIPSGQLAWRMPSSSEEISWGTSPSHAYLAPHDLWKVVSSNAVVLASGDTFPYLAVKQYGNGWFVYYAGLQPLVGHGGFAPGMYTYVIIRKAIEWAFELANLPVPRISPMPFAYDSAFMVRHDLENSTNLIANITSSAQAEFNSGARGDYYFCTGTVREDATNASTIIAGLRSAVTNYGATIGPHNGGLKNPGNPSLVRGDYDYWHWGPDEVLDLTPTNYANGKAFALASISNSFVDVESWLTGITNGVRSWVSCYFNATRDDSYDIQAQLGVKITGDQKISPFPHWTFSTRTPGLRYPFSSQPVSDWYVSNLVAQSLEPWHPPGVHTIATLHDAIDFYYGLGAPINIYSHSLSTGVGDGGFLAQEYLAYGLNTNLHPRLWSTNALGIYLWSLQRSNVQTSVSFSTNGYECITKLSVAGSTWSDTSIELLVPGSGATYGVQVLTNQILDSAGGSYRIGGRRIKVRVGTAVTNAEIRYVLGPRAQDDSYTATNGLTLNVPAPGVLSNDGRGLEPGLIASVVSGPTNGTLVLNTNGSIAYTPMLNSPGSDTFTYQASDGGTNASTGTVSIAIVSPDTKFADSFSRSTDPGSLFPWIAYAGGWSVTGGVLKGTPASLNNYVIAYQTNSSSNFSAQARIRFSSTSALGGGFGARLDPSSGARYAAWIYPEGSTGGSNVLKLVKWRTWTTFDYTGSGNGFMQIVNLPTVGTNWHTLKLAFYGPRIAVYYDGKQVLSMTDTEVSPAPYLSGGLSTAFAPTTMYNMYLDDLSVTPLSGVESYTTPEDTTLVVPAATGVLNNDTAVFGTNLTATLLAAPTNGSLSLSTNGGFTYIPATNYNGIDTFIYQANDGQTNFGAVAVTITITPVADAPTLPAQSNRTINELTLLTVTNTASDPDFPAQGLTYQLLSAPAGATISTNGIISWTPSESQGPETNAIITVVNDNGSPPLSSTNSFTVVVNEVNLPPLLPPQTNFTTIALTPVVVTNTATDPDIPANTLSYVLTSGPTNAVVSTNGVISWTPVVAQVPSTNLFTTVVTDNNLAAVNAQHLSATNTFTVVVQSIHNGPNLGTLTNRTFNELTTLQVANTATANDIPPLQLTYQLLSPPGGASISTNGIISWTPSESQGPGTNAITTVVSDNGSPPLSATNSFIVFVTEVNSSPAFVATPPSQTVVPGATLTITNAATDPDIPANNLSYTLLSPPAAAAISASGVITWTPTSAQNRTTNLFRTAVTDDGTPPLGTTNTFTIIVDGDPVLALISATLALEGCLPTNNAIDPGETVTVLFSIRNNGLGSTTNLFATLLQTNGVIVSSGAQAYGAIPAAGGTAVQPFTFANSGSCGGAITAILRLQDGPANLGTISTTLPLSSVITVLTQNFDAVTAPALPAGWTTTASGAQLPWFTTNTLADTTPNAVFSTDAGNVGINEMISPAVTLPAGLAQLSFRNNYAFEADASRVTNGYDGGVLEIKIGTNAFVDITNAGGIFLSNGYTRKIDPLFSNPLSNRWAWSGTNGGNALTVVRLPTAAAGQTIQLRWRAGTDDGTGGPGWRIDSISITANGCCSGSTPVLIAQNNRTIAELAILTVTNTATDPNAPPGGLAYSLISPPTGASISSNGIITWTPSESQGPGTNTIITVVNDNSWPPLSATNSFTVVVNEVNLPPVLPPQTNFTVVALTPVVVTNTATDPDIPANNLNYSLTSGPTNAVISTNGVISWTPVVAQMPSTNVFTTVVTDSNPAAVNTQQLSATNTFTVVVVAAIHNGPTLSAQTNRTVNELATLVVTNTATVNDIPALELTYQLLVPLLGMSIDTNGIITWTPDETFGPGTNTIITIVTDNGSPPLSATNTFTVVINEVNSVPVLPIQTNRTIVGLASLTVTNTASDSDIPVNTLAYSIAFGPTNAAIDSNGVITWIPVVSQVPSTNVFTTVVTDDNPAAVNEQQLSATNTFIIVVDPVRIRPTLPAQTNRTIVGLAALVVTNTASAPNIPPMSLTYNLSLAPTNAGIDTNGIITWIPEPAHIPSTNVFRTTVCDDGLPALSDTNAFIVVVEAAPAGTPEIQSIAISGGIVNVTWSSVVGHDYRLEYTDFMPGSNWSAVSPDIHALDSTCAAANDAGSARQRFYRVRLLP